MPVANKTEQVYLFGPEVIRLNTDEHVLSPTQHGQTISQTIATRPELFSGKSVLDVGTGSGILAILASKLGADSVDILDIDERVIDRALDNGQLNQVNFDHMILNNWLNFLPPRKYDVIVSNPPFFNVKDKNKRLFIDGLIANAPKFLNKFGQLLFVHSSMADFALTERALVRSGFKFEVIRSYRGLFREDYFRENGFLEHAARIKNGFEVIHGYHIETLRVYLAGWIA